MVLPLHRSFAYNDSFSLVGELERSTVFNSAHPAHAELSARLDKLTFARHASKLTPADVALARTRHAVVAGRVEELGLGLRLTATLTSAELDSALTCIQADRAMRKRTAAWSAHTAARDAGRTWADYITTVVRPAVVTPKMQQHAHSQ
jgi:hypothetical protein